MAEDHLRQHPEDKEVVVFQAEDHMYILALNEGNELVRLHYDRRCNVCREWFLHEDGLPLDFVCEECGK